MKNPNPSEKTKARKLSTKKPQTSDLEQPRVPEMPPKRKEWEELTIADDYMFKLVMSHKRICKHLLEIILGVKIRKIMSPKTEHPIKNSYESKGIRLDVYVEDDQDTVYDIEMQVRKYPEAYLGHRTRYYQSVIDFEALDAGVEYNKLKKSIIIFICPFKIFDGKRHLYTFNTICNEDTTLKLDDGTTKILLSTKGTLNDVDQKVKNFLDFVDGLPVNDKWVDKIRELIAKLKQDEREKANYMTYQMKLNEERAEGRKEGEEKERKEGIRNLIATIKELSSNQAQAVEQLMKRYSLTQSEAQAAVQANW